MAAELNSASGNWDVYRTYGVYVQKAHLNHICEHNRRKFPQVFPYSIFNWQCEHYRIVAVYWNSNFENKNFIPDLALNQNNGFSVKRV